MLIYLMFLAVCIWLGYVEGDMTFAVFMCLFGVVIVADELEERVRAKRQVKKVAIKSK